MISPSTKILIGAAGGLAALYLFKTYLSAKPVTKTSGPALPNEAGVTLTVVYDDPSSPYASAPFKVVKTPTMRVEKEESYYVVYEGDTFIGYLKEGSI